MNRNVEITENFELEHFLDEKIQFHGFHRFFYKMRIILTSGDASRFLRSSVSFTHTSLDASFFRRRRYPASLFYHIDLRWRRGRCMYEAFRAPDEFYVS